MSSQTSNSEKTGEGEPTAAQTTSPQPPQKPDLSWLAWLAVVLAATMGSVQQSNPAMTVPQLYNEALLLLPKVASETGTYIANHGLILGFFISVTISSFALWAMQKPRTGSNPAWSCMAVAFLLVLGISTLPHNRASTVLTQPAAFSPEQCARIIAETKSQAEATGFTTSRHRYHPTEDIPLSDIPAAHAFALPLLESRVLPTLTKTFCNESEDVGGCDVWLKDVFVVRYTQESQPSLGEHTDGHHVSFNVALSSLDDYEGGGTIFSHENEQVKKKKKKKDGDGDGDGAGDVALKVHRIAQGSVLMHQARIKHAGAETTSGTRWILVGFTELIPRSISGRIRSYLLDLHGALATKFTHKSIIS